MASEEDNLGQSLVPPENVDNPEGEWTKGEPQPAACRDAWAAILFYAQFIAIAVVAGVLGVPAVKEFDENNAEDVTDVDYTGLIYATLVAGGSSFALSAISLFVMSMCPKFLIQISLLFSLAVSALVMVYSFMIGSIGGGIIGIIFFLISCCYAWAVWRRIPFAAANLNTGLTAVKKNWGVVLVAYIITVVSFVYSVVWMVALAGVYSKEECVNGVCSSNVSWAYFFFMLLALFWTEQVLQNTIHVIIAGVVGTWWFSPDEASSCCSKGITDSFIRATTTSFGSICFGSLLVAIIETLKTLVQSATADDDTGGCAAFLLCLVECLLSCLEGILEYFNKFAYIYVGLYGYSYLEAGKNVFTLFQQKGWTVIINDDLVSNTLSLFCLVIGLLTGAIGLVMNETNPSWFEGFKEAGMGVAFGFSFLIGIVISSIMLSLVDSSVNTVVVCFAEGPAEFEQNHPKLSSEMREAWMKVYPSECGF
ncbi:hypothetical protein ACHAXS_010696 [Conticribra weissflogii]